MPLCYPVAAGLVPSNHWVDMGSSASPCLFPYRFLLRVGDHVRTQPFVVVFLQFFLTDLLPFQIVWALCVTFGISPGAFSCAWAVRSAIVAVKCHVSSPILRGCTGRTSRRCIHPAEERMSAAYTVHTSGSLHRSPRTHGT